MTNSKSSWCWLLINSRLSIVSFQECDDYDEKDQDSIKRGNSSPLNLVDGEREENDDEEDEGVDEEGSHIDGASQCNENDGVDEYDDDDEDEQRHSVKDNNIASVTSNLLNSQSIAVAAAELQEHAKAAAAVAHINGTSEYISFEMHFLRFQYRWNDSRFLRFLSNKIIL